MPHPSTERLLTLHGVRLSGLGSVERIAGRASLDEAAVEAVLVSAEAEGLARYRTRLMAGWFLTPPGRLAGARLLADELVATGVRPAVEAAYHRFRRHLGAMVAVRADWEWLDVRTSRPNDHTDPIHDASLVERLADLHRAASPVWTDLGGVLDRFLTYGPRFESALAHVQAGRFDWFTQPLIDSYHSVWFELHEDLLATLGVERSKEETY